MQEAESSTQQPELLHAPKSLIDIVKGAQAVFQKEKEAACEKVQQESAQLRKDIEAIKVEWRHQTAAAKADHDTAMAQLTAKHAAEAKVWESALVRHDSESKLFKYTVRGSSGPLHSGSVPRSIFAAEPTSALARMYNGEWAYAKDEQGQAVVNSNPNNWPIILDWLSFGAVPKSPSDNLVAECKYWQLDKLLAAMNVQENGNACISLAEKDSHDLTITFVVVDGNDGFTIKGTIHQFPSRLSTAAEAAQDISIPLRLAGRKWLLCLSEESFDLGMVTGPELTNVLWKGDWGSGPCAVSRQNSKEKSLKAGGGLTWKWTRGEVKRMMHPSMLSFEGSLPLTMTVTFKPLIRSPFYRWCFQ